MKTNNITGLIQLILFALLMNVTVSCSGSRQFVSPHQLPDDRKHIPEPKFRKYNHVTDGFDKQFTYQLKQSLDISRQLRHLFGKPKQAYNIDAFDEVLNSSWFTNRNAKNRMPLEMVAKGPNTNDGPDTSGIWTIKRAKSEGVTPGFHIVDNNNNRYVIKFDPVGYSELATGAEVVSTKLFYAAGYHVPENHIAYFNPDILRLDDNV